jgi:hypothetical protein
LILLAATSHGAVVSYNATTDLSTYFNVNGGASFTNVNTGGLGGSGSIATSTTDGTAVLKTGESYDFTVGGANVTITQDFKANLNAGGSNLPGLELGIIGTLSGQLGPTNSATPSFSVEVLSSPDSNPVTYALGNSFNYGDNGSGGFYVGGIALTSGSYYQLWGKFTRTSDGVASSAAIYAVDAVGAAIGSPIAQFGPVIFANAAFTSDHTVYPAFRGFKTGGASNFDNFVSVPEPTSGLLTLLGSLLCAGARCGPGLKLAGKLCRLKRQPCGP